VYLQQKKIEQMYIYNQNSKLHKLSTTAIWRSVHLSRVTSLPKHTHHSPCAHHLGTYRVTITPSHAVFGSPSSDYN